MRITLAGLVLVALFPTAALCRDDALPKAEEVLDRFVEVTGGVEAYAKIRNRRERIEYPATSERGVTISVIDKESPDSLRGRTEYPNGSANNWGYCAGVGWGGSSHGFSLMSEKDKKWGRYRAQFDLEHDWRKLYSEANVSARVRFDRIECHKVDLETKSGLRVTQYFEVRTGLRRGVSVDYESPQGTRHSTRVLTDYRDVDGLLIPHQILSTNRMVETGVESSSIGKVLAIEHNVEFPNGHFEPPAEIGALVEKGKGAKKE